MVSIHEARRKDAFCDCDSMQGPTCSIRCPHRGNSTQCRKSHLTHCLLRPIRRDCPDHVGQNPLEGENNPPQSSDRIPRAFRDKVLDSRTESVLQVSKVPAHCETCTALHPKCCICGETHLSDICQKKKHQNQEVTVKCVNCGDNHPTSSKRCQV